METLAFSSLGAAAAPFLRVAAETQRRKQQEGDGKIAHGRGANGNDRRHFTRSEPRCKVRYDAGVLPGRARYERGFPKACAWNASKAAAAADCRHRCGLSGPNPSCTRNSRAGFNTVFPSDGAICRRESRKAGTLNAEAFRKSVTMTMMKDGATMKTPVHNNDSKAAAAADCRHRRSISGSELWSRNSRAGFNTIFPSDGARCRRESRKAGTLNVEAFRKGVTMTMMKDGATRDVELSDTAGRGGAGVLGIGKWRVFARSFATLIADADRMARELSGLKGFGECFLGDLASEDLLGRVASRALATAMALCVFGAAVQTPPSSAATFAESADITAESSDVTAESSDVSVESSEVTAESSDVTADSLEVTRVVELPPVPTEFPPLPDIAPLVYEKFLLPNGLRVFLLEDHERGLVGGEILVQGGAKVEPADKVGLARLSATVQRSGGSIAHPAEDLDSKLDVLAARIEASSSVSEMNVGFRCLTEDLPVVLSLFSEVVQEPLMPESKLELARSQFVGAIARRPDDAGGIAAREFNKILYGKESVYSRVAELATVKSVNRDDLLAFHSKNYRPDKGVLGIWGDFDATVVKKLVEQQFGDWTPSPQEDTRKSGSAALLSESERGYSKSPPSVYLINRPGLTQGYVRMGEFGTTLADPDVFALDVLNGILNGFGGLLFDEVRSREGLAYSVSGGWSPAVEHRGAFIAGGETRVQSIPQFVQAVKRVLGNVTSEPPTADMLAAAKEKALNSFVFNFADSGTQLARVLSYELFGIDEDFLFKYKEGVEATTAVDVMKAAQRHLHPDSQPVLIVTDAQQLKPLLSAFNQQVVPLAID